MIDKEKNRIEEPTNGSIEERELAQPTNFIIINLRSFRKNRCASMYCDIERRGSRQFRLVV
jgi:hypothetical protein